MTVKEMMDALRQEQVNTWFDLGLFIDRFREQVSYQGFDGSYDDYKKLLEEKGVAFISFYYSVDGITIEVGQYAKIFRTLFPKIPIHYIASAFYDESDELIADYVIKKEITEINGFDNWDLYDDFFHKKMERGNDTYNALIKKYWNEVLVITGKLGKYIEENNLGLLYLINVNSNPGNVALALATVLVSEYMGIPVINNSHDYYWEGGSREVDIRTKGLPVGPRDFFFTNAHVGEVFSVIEVLYPWRSRSWMTVNINSIQNKHVIAENGLNPANVTSITTAVNPDFLKDMSKREAINAFKQVATIFSTEKTKVIAYSVDEYLQKENFDLQPVLLGNKTIHGFDFVNDNIIFLQPTRIISRKSIELNFKLLDKLFANSEFCDKFNENPAVKLTILISGPIPPGQKGYYQKLLKEFSHLLSRLPKAYRDKVYLGFLFSYFDKQAFRRKHSDPITIRQLYNIASLVLLPSQTEGRGLPILEASACGTPVFCRQYEPRTVFEEVIGYHLDEHNRLKVYEFSGDDIDSRQVAKIIEHIFYPQNAMDIILHNKQVIQRRYSIKILEENIEYILYRHYLQLRSMSKQKEELSFAKTILQAYKRQQNKHNENLEAILDTKNRHYLPGYGRLAFMLMLKSLIDPSFFRVEEQLIRGMALGYAQSLLTKLSDEFEIDQIHYFLNLVEMTFMVQDGEYAIRHDHSFAYRHRNKKHYLYQDFTHQEMLGVVNMLYTRVLRRRKQNLIVLTPKFFTDWNMALEQMTNGKTLGIDDREILMKKLKENVPKGYFPGPYSKHELEYFVLQPVRALLKLPIEEKLTEQHLKNGVDLAPVYVFVQNPAEIKGELTEIEKYLEQGQEEELTVLYRNGIIRLVETKQWSNGVHFLEMGEKAITVLKQIKEGNGFFIANGEYAAMMTDFVNIDHFHIGKAEHEMTAKILGIEKGQGFVQFVPAGIRTTLAYPTPVQTAKDFDEAIKSERFERLKKRLGEKTLWQMIRDDAAKNGTPIQVLLKTIEVAETTQKTEQNSIVKTVFTGGVYDDGLPWSGVMAEINLNQQKWHFSAYITPDVPKNVPALIDEYKHEKQKNHAVNIAWNGGYILNPELVGKLGLPETYIGSPLGLLVIDGEVKSPPLFNKPAFIVYRDGHIDIRRVTVRNGFSVSKNGEALDFTICNEHSATRPSFYDLMQKETIVGDGNVIVRLAGNVVKDIIYTKPKEMVSIIPVGLTLSIPRALFSETLFENEKEITIHLFDDAEKSFLWQEIAYAIEAGPMLLENGTIAIDMEYEGWKTVNSIRTQAARLDFVDMRGPKIAVGKNDKGEMKVLVVNGRIRESVGATHYDMAKIFLENGMSEAMGFDPGGSATLVVDGKMMNISPYNKRYEESIYSLPPEARFVSNIIMGWGDNIKL